MSEIVYFRKQIGPASAVLRSHSNGSLLCNVLEQDLDFKSLRNRDMIFLRWIVLPNVLQLIVNVEILHDITTSFTRI